MFVFSWLINTKHLFSYVYTTGSSEAPPPYSSSQHGSHYSPPQAPQYPSPQPPPYPSPQAPPYSATAPYPPSAPPSYSTPAPGSPGTTAAGYQPPPPAQYGSGAGYHYQQFQAPPPQLLMPRGNVVSPCTHCHLHLPNKMKQTATLTCSLFLEHRSISNNCPVRIYAAVVRLVVPVCACMCMFPKN